MEEVISQEFTEILKGKTIESIRYLTDEETKDFYWHEKGFVILFTDGTEFIPIRDPEGNGPGALSIYDGKTKENHMLGTL